MRWRCRDRVFDLGERTLVMGILNVTPDSFSDGGRFFEPKAAIERGLALIGEGADLVDVGGESTRPGSAPVAAEEQWRRIGPVLQALAGRTVLSVDTSSAWVAERALMAGAQVVNDVTALGDPAMAEVVTRAAAGLVLMHMQGTPLTMQRSPHYDDAVSEVREGLARRWQRAHGAGVQDEAVALDPGIGFGKALEHNLALLTGYAELAALGRPVVVGVSRKSFLGRLLDREVDERLEGALAATAIAVFQGAAIVRTHDVTATARAVRVADALRAARSGRSAAPRGASA